MNDYQIFDLIIKVTGLVISAVMLGIAITKNNRHQTTSIYSGDLSLKYLGVEHRPSIIHFLLTQ